MSIGKVRTISTLERATGKRVPRTYCQVVAFYPQLRDGYIKHVVYGRYRAGRARARNTTEVTHTADVPCLNSSQNLIGIIQSIRLGLWQELHILFEIMTLKSQNNNSGYIYNRVVSVVVLSKCIICCTSGSWYLWPCIIFVCLCPTAGHRGSGASRHWLGTRLDRPRLFVFCRW